ncbi:hypothetical protein M378DRAFT_91442 [Amanita muscaria Koide BX008]|uniref:Wax synthase domain-containing protein n=1 Tax=Amanita muscaria (strain Koide BX008) TaxID=946122 RepID=A0A0C2RXM7_AMAMK|nr:hypothetical protein M378DRAFT_91442 [Amanita muscaria Koide BX008]
MTVAAALCYASVHLFSFLALVAKPSPFRSLFMIPIMLAVVTFLRSGPEYQENEEYILACTLIVQFFTAADYILLTDVQRELTIKGQKEPVYKRPLLERLKWAASLHVNSRGIGWDHEPTHALPSRPPPSITRSKFILHQLRRLASQYALYAAATVYIRKTPYFVDGHSFMEDGVFWQCVNTIASLTRSSTTLNMPHEVLGIVCVAAGITEPHQWVPFFGPISEIYSLRNFWGRFWHQNLRRPLASFGHLVAYKILNLKAGSLSAYLVQVYVGFAISGTIHLCGDYLALGNWAYQRAFLFFMLQAVGIHIEVLFTRWFSFPKSWKWMGYVWVLTWFVYTLPGWVSGMPWYNKVNATEYLVSKFLVH